MVTQVGEATAGRTKSVFATKTRPADTDAYSAEDVVSESATNDVGTPFIFTLPPRSSGYITEGRIQVKTAGVTAAFTLFLFNALPTSELDDNAANTAPDYEDLAAYQGRIDFPGMSDLGGDSSWSQATPSTAGGLPVRFATGSTGRLWGVLVTRDALTPASAAAFRIDLVADIG